MEEPVWMGVDAGGTWVKAGLCNESGQVVAEVKVPSGAAEGQSAYAQSVREAVAQLDQAVGRQAPIGLSIPGLLTRDRQGVWVMANVKGMDNLPAPVGWAELLGGEVASRLRAAENDAGAAAWAEWLQAGGNRDSRLLLVTWGTGIGTALVAEGRVAYGWEGGHMPARPEADESGGKDWESQAAVPGIIRRVRQKVEAGGSSPRLQAADVADGRAASRAILQAAEAGDPLAREEVGRAADWMGWGIQVLASIGCPDEVVIGGAFMASEWLLAEVRQAVVRYNPDISKFAIRPEQVRRAELGNRAGIVGAADLARRAAGPA